MVSSTFLAFLFWIGAGLIVYHHVAYPLLLRFLAKKGRGHGSMYMSGVPFDNKHLPSIHVIIPAYNEAAFIAQKVANLAALDYPSERVRFTIACDGCTDRTVEFAHKALDAVHGENPERAACFVLYDYTENRGKVAILNELLADHASDITVFTDVSAYNEADVLHRVVPHFSDSKIGVVCGTYMLDEASEGEQLYWAYQRRIKRDENRVGALMGAHGAFYAVRTEAVDRLEPDTINDDFMLPMRIIGKGYSSIYDTSIVTRELEVSMSRQDYFRRVRIAAGAMQQMMRLPELFSLKRPGIAFIFASGKALRCVLPFVFAMMLMLCFVLALRGLWPYTFLFPISIFMCLLGVFQIADPRLTKHRFVQPFAYLAAGHMAGLVGGLRFLMRLHNEPWSRAADLGVEPDLPLGFGIDFVSPVSRYGKRAFDIVVASVAFVLFAVLFPFIALIIKLDSKGPIFYLQMRVGERTENESKLFLLMKFRTMRVDAEVGTGAVWATKNDPRITRFGNFMRKTRFDEFPQCINVLLGDMSIVGPRPERPVFFAKLEQEIPYYTERTFGLKPGITGLAQVTTGYDESVEDVREKVLHDHVYATRIVRPFEWFVTDISICIRTFTVMVLGKGQ